jgi:hypothetical protein
MTEFEPGERFPDLALSDSDGRPARLPPGEKLVAFFHTDCATSEMSWPYLERIRRLAAGGPLRLLAVSQDGVAETRRFNGRARAAVETLFDPPPWRASEALGLAGVPAFFLVGADGRIRERADGFDRAKMEEFAARAAALAGRETAALFSPGESVPAIRPG